MASQDICKFSDQNITINNMIEHICIIYYIRSMCNCVKKPAEKTKKNRQMTAIKINFYFSFQKMAKWSSQHNGKFPDPYAKLVLDEEKKHKKKKKKKDKNRDRDSILSQLDPNVTNKVRQDRLFSTVY